MKRNIMYGLVTVLTAFLIVGFFTLAQEAQPPAAGDAAPAKTDAAPAPAKADVAPAKADVAPATADAKKPSEDLPIINDAKAAAPAAKSPTIVAGETVVVDMPKDKEEPASSIKTTSTPPSDSRISLTFDDTPLMDVIRMFIRISGVNIIVNATNVQGRVTANLTEVEWKPALQSILDMHNLRLEEKIPGSGVYNVVTKTGGEPMLVETIFLKYAAVSNVQDIVRAMVQPVGGASSAFPSRNALVVRTTAANLGEVKQVIEKIDKLRDQVFIEAKFMELNDEAIKDLGINWQALEGYKITAAGLTDSLRDDRKWTTMRADKQSQWDHRRQTDTVHTEYDENGMPLAAGAASPTLIGNLTPAADQATYNSLGSPRSTIDSIDKGVERTSDLTKQFDRTFSDVKTAILGLDDFQLVLSALKQMNGVSIVSNPKIIVANEEPATIHIGQTERPFVSSITPATTVSAPVVTYNPGEPVDLGVKLTVTPTVNTSSNITVKIQPELKRFVRDAVAPNGQTYPIVSTKKITTIFCLESGKTVAIGGLTESSDRDNTKKIPLLGDIPIIGKYLFSYTHTEKAQQETIIFVTVGLALPEKIEPEAGLPEDTELTQRRILQSRVRRAEYISDLDKEREATDKAVEKTKARLLDSKR